MDKREPLKSNEYFQKLTEHYSKEIEQYNIDFDRRPEHIKRWDVMHLFQYANYFSLFRSNYSQGKNIQEIRFLFDKTIHHAHAYYTYPPKKFSDSSVTIDTYFEGLHFCSLAILLKSNQETLNKLQVIMNLIRVDRLTAKFTESLNFNLKKMDNLFFTKSFEKLDSVFKATDKSAKEELLKKYLEEYMLVIKPSAYAGSHKIKVNDTSFFGYWSFEAAAVVVIENLDFEKFKDITFFPADLVKFYYGK